MWLVAALLDGADKDHSHPCKGFYWTVLAWTQCSLHITDFGTSSSCLRPTMTSTFLEKTKRFHEPQSPCDLALHHLVCFVPHCSPSCFLGHDGRLSVPPLATVPLHMLPIELQLLLQSPAQGSHPQECLPGSIRLRVPFF